MGENGSPEFALALGKDYPEGVLANAMDVLYWPDTAEHRAYEDALKELSESQVFRLILLDMADEVIDSSITLEKYQEIAKVVTFEGGSHGFEHIEEALPVIKDAIYSQ